MRWIPSAPCPRPNDRGARWPPKGPHASAGLLVGEGQEVGPEVSPYDRVVDKLKANGARHSGKNWTCPAHDDRDPSLSVNPGIDWETGEPIAPLSCRMHVQGCPICLGPRAG